MHDAPHPARVVLVGGAPFTDRLEAGLADGGRAIRILAPPAGPDGDGPSFDEALDDAARALGGVDAVVFAWGHRGLQATKPFVEVSAAEWHEACEGSLEVIWRFAQSLARRVPAWQPRSVVFVMPTAGLSGMTGGTMLATVAEGVRQLAKACAAQWGDHGTSVNVVATDSTLWLAEAAAGEAFGLTEAPLRGSGDPAVDLAPAVGMLVDGTARFLTAATLVVDGGTWRGL